MPTMKYNQNLKPQTSSIPSFFPCRIWRLHARERESLAPVPQTSLCKTNFSGLILLFLNHGYLLVCWRYAFVPRCTWEVKGQLERVSVPPYTTGTSGTELSFLSSGRKHLHHWAGSLARGLFLYLWNVGWWCPNVFLWEINKITRRESIQRYTRRA